MSSNLMSTERGGEGDQYEDSIDTMSKSHAKQTGQLGGNSAPDDAQEQSDQQKVQRGEQTAENIRYGQKLSEEGMGGQTTGQQGSASQASGYGNVESQEDESSAAKSRRQQGYGPGSGVGA